MKSTPASTTLITTKPSPSAAVSRAPKGTSIEEIKGLVDDELDYDDNMENEDKVAALASHRSLPEMRNLKTLKRILIHSATHQVMGLLNNEMIIILTIRSPEVDPEVNLEADHLVDLAVLLPKVTEFILATGLMLMTGAKIETTDQIMANTTVMTMTDTAPVTTGIVMTDTMTSTKQILSLGL